MFDSIKQEPFWKVMKFGLRFSLSLIGTLASFRAVKEREKKILTGCNINPTNWESGPWNDGEIISEKAIASPQLD